MHFARTGALLSLAVALAAPVGLAQTYPTPTFPDLGYFNCNEATGATVNNTAFPGVATLGYTFPAPGAMTFLAPGQLGASALNVSPATMGAGVPLASGVAPNYGGAFTVEFWLNVQGANQANLCWDTSAGAFQIVGPATTAAGTFSWRGGGTTATNEYVNFTYNTAIGVWQHVALVQDPSIASRRAYVNGVLNASATFSPPPAGYPAATGLIFGGNAAGGVASDFAFDEIRVWSRARTLAEIAANYQAELTLRNGLTVTQSMPGDITLILRNASLTADNGWTLMSAATTGAGNQGPVFGIYFDILVYQILTDSTLFPQVPGFPLHFPRSVPFPLFPEGPFSVGPGTLSPTFTGLTYDFVTILTGPGFAGPTTLDSASNVVRHTFL